MQVQDILQGKKKIVEFLKEKGFQEEIEYSDEDYKEGIYFKIDKRKLLVLYEVPKEEKIKEIKNHFLIDRGLSYCLIIFDSKIIFFRNFGETKYFIYSERCKENIFKIDKIKRINDSFDSIFQTEDNSYKFYEAFKIKRNLLVQNIKNDVKPVQKYLISQKIFDRFFFIYFLCHKGIIKFKDGTKVSGDNLFTKILLKNGKFLDNLKNMFHLFNSQEKNILELGNYHIIIPYLNGGLFRPDVLEHDLDIRLNEKQWEEIFNFLNSYNWIIEDVKITDENEDRILTPEILGHVYERSVVEWESEGFEKEAENAVKKITERKKKGVYYTPESITDYISNNTIIPCLLNKLENKYLSFDELIESKSKKDMKEALKILDEIKILDPACGSGAFPIKAAEVILGLKRRLYYELKEKKDLYDLKLDIITENIYGVDILEGAIEIAKLRLWLWLISDFEESKNEIKALPNIEYNLKVGNSLIGWLDEKLDQIGREGDIKSPLTEKVDGIFTGLIAFSENNDGEDLKKARELLKGYKLNDYIEAYYTLYKIYRRTHGLKAENLRIILETIRKSIYATVTPAFRYYVNKKIKPNHKITDPPITEKEFSELQVLHWRIDFGHIILNGGFDVVIGNPPYIRIHKQKDETREYNKAMFYSAFKDYDIYVLFFERSLNLLSENGNLGFITPDKFLVREYGQRIREFILSYRINELFDVSRARDIFDAATYPLISFIKKDRNVNKKIKIKFARTIEALNSDYDEIQLSQEECKVKGLIELIPSSDRKILNKIYRDAISLGELIDKDQIFCGTPRAKDYHSWAKYISNKKSNNSLKLFVCAHLSPYKIDFKKKVNTLGLSIQEPFFNYEDQIMSDSRLDDFKFAPKILIRSNDTRITAVLDNEGAVFIGIYGIKVEKNIESSYKYLLALLNSKLYQWIFSVQNPSIKISGDFFSINTPQLFRLPYKKIDTQILKKFNNLVDEIISITKENDYPEKQKKVKELQDKIDQLIYKIYDLTPEEINIVEDFSEKK